MARPKKLPNETDESTETEVEETVVTSKYHPSEIAVEVNGKPFLQWTDDAGCTFVEPA